MLKRDKLINLHITKTYEALQEREVVLINPPTKRILLATWPIFLGYFGLTFSAALNILVFAFLGIMSILWIILYTIAIFEVWKLCNFNKRSMAALHVLYFIFNFSMNMFLFYKR